jgi:transcriptional regulator with XRE-family HTH domain
MVHASDKQAPDQVDIHVGRRIRARRRLCKVSQVELADHIGLSFQQVQKYERGLNRVSASKLYAIAKRLGAPINHFFDGMAEPDLQPGDADRAQRPEQEFADFLASDEGRELVNAFRLLGNERLRRGCLDFLKLVAAETNVEASA